MNYIDTSVLVAALTVEQTTSRVQQWLADQTAGDIAISDWTVTEFSSALSIKIRTAHLTKGQRDIALTAFRQIALDSLEVFSISPVDFHRAADFSDNADFGLRAGDALHLAIATANSATVYTLDRHFCNAANRMGIHSVCL